jgi:hypothetical protein
MKSLKIDKNRFGAKRLLSPMYFRLLAVLHQKLAKLRLKPTSGEAG